jgi:transposase
MLIAGDKTRELIADSTRGRPGRPVRASRERTSPGAVDGVVSDTTRFLLHQMLTHIDQVQAAVDEIDARIGELLQPMREPRALLVGLPGVDSVSAAGLLAEIGPDMSVFPSANHLTSWGGLAPGSHESAGKRKAVSTRSGSHWLRVFLVQAAWGATRTKGSFWKRTFERLRARLGPQQALVAIARKMLVAIFHMLRDQVPYRELGADYVGTEPPERRANRLVNQLKSLGFQVQLSPIVSPS